MKLRGRESGTILIFALVLAAAGAIVLAGWVSLMAGRAVYTEQMNAAIKRRLVLENSRHLAAQYVRQNVMAGTYLGARNANVDGGEWGRFTFTSTVAATPLESLNLPIAANLYSPGGDGGYTTDLPVQLYSDEETSSGWVFHVRSRNPMLGFDLLTVQNALPSTGASVTANLSVLGDLGGNAMLWPPAEFEMTAVTYQTPSGAAFSGKTPAPAILNFPFPPVTSGTLGGIQPYDGTFSVIEPVLTGSFSLAAKAQTEPYVSVFSGSLADVNLSADPPNPTPVQGVSCQVVGGVLASVTVDLSDAGLQRVCILGTGTSVPPKIILQGQVLTGDSVADELPAVLIVYIERMGAVGTLQAVELQNENNRRLHLAVRKEAAGASAVAIDPGAGGHAWRLLLTAENTPLQFTPDTGATLRLTGGIRTNNSVLVNGGFVQIVRENEPRLMERNADRMAWLEMFKQ